MKRRSYLAAPIASFARPKRGRQLPPLRWAVAPVGLLVFAGPSRSATTVFSDNFNRANASTLGANWTAIFGDQLGVVGNKAANVTGTNNPINVLTGLTADYTHTGLQVDISNPGGVGGQSVALCVGMNPGDNASGLYMQFRTIDTTGLFKIIEMDTGTNMSDPTKWTTPGNQFIPATPFATAWVTVAPVDADTIQVGIDTDKNGVPEETFTRDLNLANAVFGNRMGISINGTTARADDFVATVVNPANVTWNVNGGGTWDFTSNNWTGGSLSSTRFLNTDHAIFNNTFGGTITLAGGANAAAIVPGSVTVSASTGTYTFAGTGILGSGPLIKSGFGRLVLTNPNAFTGDTTVTNSGGILANGSGAHLTLGNPSGNSLAGDLHIGVASASGGNVAKVSLAQSNQIADNRVVYFDSSVGNYAYFSLRGNSETIAGIVSTSTGGAIENGNLNGAINTNSTLTLAPPIGVTRTFAGIIRDADSGGGTGKLNIAVNGAGTGTQVIGSGGTYSYTGTTTVSGGKLQLQTNLTTSSSIAVSGGTLELAAGGGSNRVIKTGSVSATGSGKIDLKDNKLIVTAQPVGSWNGSAYSGVTGLIASGHHGGDWLGTSGIITSQSSATSGQTLTSIGVAANADLARSTFGGVSVGANDTLVMYTYAGDANVDGAITGDDYFQIDSAFPQGLHGWFNGDFNYDGSITGDDYFLIDSNFPAQGAAFPTSSALGAVSPVPEPMTLAQIGLLVSVFAVRRRRGR